ncbi:MAG: Crp/Fnr family transcriptional regulator [Oscillospiraceae bacterium]
MKNIFDRVKDNPLFAGIPMEEFEQMLSCIGAQTANYRKGEVIFLMGNAVESVGLVLSGSVQIVWENADGHCTMMAELSASELFGETFACAGTASSPVSVVAADDCEILLLNYRKIITTCSSSCSFHARLIANMLQLMARKNLLLNRKIEILSKRTTRERLLTFFDTQRGTARQFSIPYNREELAALLCVERSAMSAELSKMQRDGLIRFRKNQFELL